MRIERDDYIIQGIQWKVRLASTDSELALDEAYGRTNFETHTITLADEMPFEEMIETLIHETIHVLTRGRESCDLTREDDVRTFSIALVDTIIRNKLSFCPTDHGW
jgi:hypothetical protein